MCVYNLRPYAPGGSRSAHVCGADGILQRQRRSIFTTQSHYVEGFQNAHPKPLQCVFITAVPITKLFNILLQVYPWAGRYEV